MKDIENLEIGGSGDGTEFEDLETGRKYWIWKREG